ncbi:TPA: P-type DNA transfer ATPase VirB11 [Escherichia coli]|uniref:P-type DNA transfer ATPase VirB11 n=1 Tax=Escherichia coli TaxID=562 RepID=UPI000DDC099F|nr:P-type DNA transfer ATPase VirB11 [Escherichia coli]EJJ4131363.1 P-type DNA transfer ATPase VirB11 [Salmonella enterica]MTW71301.1 P-type DNA transfer ATPase VirB11 [Klebsiella pneumoniae]ELH8374977.1 P-type DNA transfer ATPase VirB11 [Salmonella enterica]ELL0735228.1 P-type DNA transfer ATPase VirB11 [Salmonella enterica]ELL0757498.1 P-type DNA transfer ATPase VirB11 [Salmonella enterica]
MTAKNISLDRYKQRFFGDFLELPGLTEIAVNRPGELWTKIDGVWGQHTVDLKFDDCYNFARCLAKHHNDNIEDIKPGLSATLESGERCQVVVPPACERDTISITIRKPSKIQIPHQAYIDSGFYNRVTGIEKASTHNEELIELYNSKNIPLFMEKCVEYGKTLAVAGETSTGKTTYMKMLIQYIPVHLRITTIEDNPEIIFYKHKNYVHLFYPSESSDEKGSVVTPAALIRWNYRMNPDRILLTEVRGGEAWDFLKITGSGHEGSMTSIHAGSAHEAIDGFITRCTENPQCAQLPYSFLLRKVLDSLDVVVSIDLDGNIRRMNDIYFRPLHRNQYYEEMKV